MAADLATTLQMLRALHDTGVLDADEYAQKLDHQRAQHGAAVVNLLLSAQSTAPAPGTTTQLITGQANLAVAIAGSQYGHIFINGYRERSGEELLAAYLGRLALRCAVMPLQGASSERDADDTLRLSIDQVYTQLATQDLTERERFAVSAVTPELMKDYLQNHVRPDLLPLAQRTAVRGLRRAGAEPVEDSDFHTGKVDHSAIDLQRTGARELSAQIQTWSATYPQVAFFGPQLVTEAMAAQRCLVLLGEPGGGKSTVLRYLARSLARAGIEEGYDPATQIDGWAKIGRLLPLFAPLLPLARQLVATPGRRGSDADLWRYLVDHLQPGGAHEGLAAAIMQEIEAGHVILLLDGLDEVAEPESRRQVAQAVHAFAEQYPACRIIVSCRIRSYDPQINPDNTRWQLPGWPTVTLADLTSAQMDQFVGAWYAAIAATDPVIAAQCDARIAELRGALRARPDLRLLGVRPLLLTIMALVHLRQRNLPEDRASLYRECVEILLARWELRGKEETEYQTLMHAIDLPGFDVKALRPLLAEIALTAHAAATPGNPGILDAAQLEVMVQRFLHTKGHPNPYLGAQKFLTYTDKRAGLLHATGAGTDYQFAHLTFQEYLAGLALIGDEHPVSAILQRRAEERWRVPIFLGIGHVVSENVSGVFLELLVELTADAESVRGQRDLILAAELAEDVGWKRLSSPGFIKLRRELARDLITVLEGATLPAAERVRAGELLSGLDDPRPGVCDLQFQMVEIPGGSFVIGSSKAEADQANQAYGDDWASREINTQSVTVAAFELARYPVTNAQFDQFIAHNGYTPTAPWWRIGRDWLQQQGHRQSRYWDDPRFGKPRLNHPVVGVSWYEATAFCAWLTQHLSDGYSYRLPSEAEWEYAARGRERRTYPWGNPEPDDEKANFNATYQGTTAVGCFSLGATLGTGLLDMAGNVWEWTRSAYRDYPYNPDDGREDGAELTQKSFTFRGASWRNQPIYLRAASRYLYAPGGRDQDVGFRLARHLQV